jgi:tyrosinase
MELPARTPAEVAPGARSRFDDFTVVHIQQTLNIHYTGNFQPWHRFFVYTYEKALRDECGYTGYQPVSKKKPPSFPLPPLQVM